MAVGSSQPGWAIGLKGMQVRSCGASAHLPVTMCELAWFQLAIFFLSLVIG